MRCACFSSSCQVRGSVACWRRRAFTADTLVSPLCTGIAFMHANNFAHHDIAADNVLLHSKANGHARVIDFGSTRSFVRDERGESLLVRRPFCLAYKARTGWAPPEHYLAQPAWYRPDKYDMWQCGQIMFFLLNIPGQGGWVVDTVGGRRHGLPE